MHITCRLFNKLSFTFVQPSCSFTNMAVRSVTIVIKSVNCNIIALGRYLKSLRVSLSFANIFNIQNTWGKQLCFNDSEV